MWKIGVADYGMNVWEGGLYDLATRLKLLQELGFDGTERLEAVSEADALHKAAFYRRCGLDFATCRGPSVQVGLEWSAALRCEYVWLTGGDLSRAVDWAVFVRRAQVFCAAARQWGVRPALHNHLGQRVESAEELERFMSACPAADLLFDVGHFVGAGGDPVPVIERYASRLAAVHLKDIELLHPEIGLERWTERLRFCELGGGNIGFDLGRVLDALKRVDYRGWIFVEQDTHTVCMEEELSRSLAAIKECAK